MCTPGPMPCRSIRNPAVRGPHKASRHSDRETGTTAASGCSVGVGHLECRPAKRFHEIHCPAANQIKADIVNDQRAPIGFSDGIVGLGRIGKAETVLETGATASLHRETQDGGLLLLGSNRGHALGRSGCQGDVGCWIVHAPYISATRSLGERAACQPWRPNKKGPVRRPTLFVTSPVGPAFGLHARTRTVGDFHATVLQFTNAIGGLHAVGGFSPSPGAGGGGRG